MSKAMGFDCHKKGHHPMKGIPEQVIILESFPHVGRICKACKGVYYEQLSDVKMEASGVLDPEGRVILSSTEEKEN